MNTLTVASKDREVVQLALGNTCCRRDVVTEQPHTAELNPGRGSGRVADIFETSCRAACDAQPHIACQRSKPVSRLRHQQVTSAYVIGGRGGRKYVGIRPDYVEENAWKPLARRRIGSSRWINPVE